MGIFKSVTAAATWNALASTQTADFNYRERIAVAPTTPASVLGRHDTGLFRSADAGQTFTEVALPQVLTPCWT